MFSTRTHEENYWNSKFRTLNPDAAGAGSSLKSWGFADTGSNRDIVTAVHELLHMSGLGHSNKSNAPNNIMSSTKSAAIGLKISSYSILEDKPKLTSTGEMPKDA